MQFQKLLAKYPIISDQITTAELTVVLRELEKVLQQRSNGGVVEFGCYSGTTSLFIRRLLMTYHDDRDFHVYDSFEGLPSKVPQDQAAAGIDFAAGELTVSKNQFLKNFQRAHLQPPITHKTWFDQVGENDLPKTIAFAFLDGDFYTSILTSLRLVWPRLADNATVLVHDYKRDTLPGVERAIHDYFASVRVAPHLRGEANIAILKA